MSIFGAIGDFISGIFKPASDLIDNVHTSEQEKLELKNKLAQIQATVSTKIIDSQMKINELENQVRLAELASSHFLAANWRPACAILLVVNIIVMSYMGVQVPTALETLTNVFVPGYGSFRMLEKITEIKNKKKD